MKMRNKITGEFATALVRKEDNAIFIPIGCEEFEEADSRIWEIIPKVDESLPKALRLEDFMRVREERRLKRKR